MIQKKARCKYLEVLDSIHSDGHVFVSGGDLNAVPPGASIDYCMNDICEGESYHVMGLTRSKGRKLFDNFIGEPDILAPLYQLYDPIAETLLTFLNTTHMLLQQVC